MANHVEPTDAPPLVLVTVGTDHHPFDRLVRWVDAWLENRSGTPVRCVVQGGSAQQPRHAEWRDYLAYDELLALMRKATVVACHAGPATILEARRAQLLPVVVPRRHDLGEHVDDHQVAFARRMARLGQIHLVESADALHEALDDAVLGVSARLGLVGTDEPQQTVRRIIELIDTLPSGNRA